ncbi:MAG: UDP-N-acetylglucosamine 2-epimerase (non-hydrolyzing) [Candidatus Diapherotrites archaeon]|uniref:UDP-N-acetylglucosamine 2-epimerase (Non-hydrolyzing) n=1 Tax=Candidatus Iainarchaeum sp. TaxID=3101447 RepID=A0A8T4L8L9_9ARCH|nr:UDP-N-acetylglucosamine 2-epimerase (non-hydrolyzing) [Candidatus Diapherotrites archaeon]
MRIAIVFGTRPEIIKLSPIVKSLKKRYRKNLLLVHTGQHYSPSLSSVFLNELALPSPDLNLGVVEESNGRQVDKMVSALARAFKGKEPALVVAEGDTNSVLAAALVSAKMGVPFAHVEAGLRSFDLNMPEEVNRIMADHLALLNFAPTKTAVGNLQAEGVDRKTIFLTGNPIVEATTKNLHKAKKSRILERLSLEEGAYVVLTAHRQETVDVKPRLKAVLSAVAKFKEPVIYPVHPRSLKMLKRFGLFNKFKNHSNLSFIEPLGYLDFLNLCSHSKLMVTDSGGIQEEATIYKKPVIIVRNNTERPEVLGRHGVLAGYSVKKILEAYKQFNRSGGGKPFAGSSPFGDGKAGHRIVERINCFVDSVRQD